MAQKRLFGIRPDATGRMIEPGDDQLAALLTSVCLLLFVLLHDPCATTIRTTWRETRSVKWTITSALLPLVLGS